MAACTAGRGAVCCGPAPVDPCPSEDTLLAVAEGSLPEHARASINDHLDRCDDCRAIVVELVRDASAPVPQAAEAAALLVGRAWTERYEVTGLLGQGGMGVVYAAWDRRLERRVALKVIRRDGRPHDEARAARLVRESRAMARLRHPNVVTVFDVGTVRGQAYLAMELVEGGTLRRWLADGPRPASEVLAMFLAAGQGLLAAHDEGLVHRDFKPDNVLVDPQGRPRVADFGLARTPADDEPSREDEDHPLEVSNGSGSGTPLTRTGAALGTPGYMAPEQVRGEPIDDRADVFAFCVALHEALLGRRPVADEPLPGDRTARELPRRVRMALHEGLRADPRARPPLRALLERLAAPPTSARVAWPLGLALATGGLVALALGLAPAEPAPASVVDACTAARAEAAASWTPEIRERLAATWGEGDDRRDFATLSQALASYHDRLGEAYASACEAEAGADRAVTPASADASGERSPAQLRLSCLEHRRLAVEAVLELVAEGDPRAAQAVDVLPSLGECSEPETLALRMPVPEDSATRAEVERIRRAVTPLHALRDAGRYAEASAGLVPLAGEAERLGFAPLHAELAYELGVARSYEGDGPEGARLMEDAALLAAGARHDTLAAEGWIQLVHVASEELHDYAAARRYAGHARTAVARLGGAAADKARARLTYYEAVLAWREGRHDDAMARYTEAIAMARGVDPELEVNAMEAKGILHVERGEHAESLALHEEVLARRRELKGELHPELAFSYGNIATAHFHAGRHRQALEWGQRAIDLHARMLGRRHPATGLDLHLQAQILGELGELPEALALAREAREAFEAARGPGHVETATMIELEGTLRLENEEYPLAEERLGEALRIFSEQAGEGSPQATGARLLLAQAQARTGKPAEAMAQGRRALDDYLRLFEPQHIRVVNARSILGEILLDEGQHEAARQQLEQALADIDPAFNVGHHGELRFLLARALLEPRVDMVEGRRQLELAEREIEEAGEAFEYGRRILAQWRRDHAELLR